jgi:hypothetical protein
MDTRMKFFMAMVFGVCSVAGNRVAAQQVATTSLFANVVTPISIVKTVDLSFGNAAVAPTAGGSIILAPSGGRTTGGSGVTLPANSGTVAAATFTVSGEPGFTYSISLPSSAVITGPGSAVMTVSGFTSSPSLVGTLSTGGAQSLAVGATLSIPAAQASGTYTNATALPVTVNYN